jgi:hypothetical protein
MSMTWFLTERRLRILRLAIWLNQFSNFIMSDQLKETIADYGIENSLDAIIHFNRVWMLRRVT